MSVLGISTKQMSWELAVCEHTHINAWRMSNYLLAGGKEKVIVRKRKEWSSAAVP